MRIGLGIEPIATLAQYRPIPEKLHRSMQGRRQYYDIKLTLTLTNTTRMHKH